jgi:peptidoglycan biosynthesis protein MviN/MurJ (putative lipid II flippase)
MFPLYAVFIRIALYFSIGLLAVTKFPSLGAPGIALAEISITIEAVIMYAWLNKKMDKRIVAWPALVRGLAAAVLSGVVTYGVAVYLPGPGYITSLVGMVAGGILALPIIYPEVRLLFSL